MAKKPGREMVAWEEEFAKEAMGERSTRAPMGAGKFIGTRGGILSVDGEAVTGNKLKCVVLTRCYENAFYVGKFDADDPQSPVCYAFSEPDWPGTDLAQLMKPHAESSKKQADACAGCPQNAWGSSDVGRGKACKNIARLALLPADALKSADTLKAAEIMFIKVPVTSVRGYHQYEDLVNSTAKRPVWAVMTELTLLPDPKTQFRASFSMINPIENAKLFPLLKERRDSAKKDIAFAYGTNAEEPAGGKRKRTGNRRTEIPKKPAGKAGNAKFRR